MSFFNSSFVRRKALEIFGIDEQRAFNECVSNDERRALVQEWESTIGIEWSERTSIIEGLGRRAYHEYLASPEWEARRETVLERDGHKCKVCESVEKLHVHHLTYERKFNEPLYDLVTLCELCHKIAHAM